MANINCVQIIPRNLTIQLAKWYYDIDVEPCPKEVNIKNIIWSSDNESIASINSVTGSIYGQALGETVIRVRVIDENDIEREDSIPVIVSETVPVESIKMNRTAAKIEKDALLALSVSIFPSHATTQTVCWCSSNPSIASVTNGVVQGYSYGTAVITAMAADGKCAYCTVEVTSDILVKSITVNPSTKTKPMGDDTWVCETVYPENATNKRVVWSSSDETIATVNDGHVFPLKQGEVKIIATAADGSGVSGYCALTVDDPIRVSSITFSPEVVVLDLQEPDRYAYIQVKPNNAYNREITLESSNPAIATIDENQCIHAVSKGEATITATATDGSGVKGSCTVIVDTREKVTVKKDTHSFYVQFADGRVWKNIGCDLSQTNTSNYQTERNRYEENASNTFSAKEIAVLYFLDPLGIEYYMKYYYLHHPLASSFDILMLKDRIYLELYGSKPKLFKRMPSGNLQYYNYPNSISSDFRLSVYSYAEVLFGFHTVFDVASIFTTLLQEIFYSLPVVAQIATGVQLYQAMFLSGAIIGEMQSTVANFLDSYMQEGMSINGKGLFSWVLNLYDKLNMIENALSLPHPLDINIYEQLDSKNFQLNFEIENSNISLGEIIALNSKN